MGAVYFFISKVSNYNLTIEFVKSFMSLKHRGQNDTSWSVESSENMTNLLPRQQEEISFTLSKDEIRKYTQFNFAYGYHRNSINDTSFNASQPFEDPILNMVQKYKEIQKRPKRKLLCNGEIYNHSELKKEYNFTEKDLCSCCDVEIIMPIYINHLESGISNTGIQSILETVKKLDGDFAFVLTENTQTFDLKTIKIFAARDPLGIKPLFWVRNQNDDFWLFISEIKGLPLNFMQNKGFIVEQVPPGCVLSWDWSVESGCTITKTKFYDMDSWKNLDMCTINDTSPDSLDNLYTNIRDTAESSVVSRYGNSDSPIGVLLSGGFDSCLITSVLCKYLAALNKEITPKIYLFTFGDRLGGEDMDIDYAELFVKYLKNKYENKLVIEHHIVCVNQIDIASRYIDKIVYHLETFEPETIRDSIPFYFLFDYIKNHDLNIKVLLSGDGLEEFCGYSQFDNLTDSEFQMVSVNLLKGLCSHDILRMDKISSMFGLEIRHPFLDMKFVELMLKIHPRIKRPMFYSNKKEPIHKYIIRKAFDSEVSDFEYLSNEILWRQHKCSCECMTNFELRLDLFFNGIISDEEFQKSKNTFLFKTPKTKEEAYYRNLFNDFFPNKESLVPIFWNEIWDMKQ